MAIRPVSQTLGTRIASSANPEDGLLRNCIESAFVKYMPLRAASIQMDNSMRLFLKQTTVPRLHEADRRRDRDFELLRNLVRELLVMPSAHFRCQ
jgi:hypothetical protein